MRATAWAVVGAGYGDEGKGLMTDAVSDRLGPDVLVVRSNGGAQAGHTVQSGDGRRHVFHHVGSASLADAPSHLSRFFVSHPILLVEEMEGLRSFGVKPQLSADPRGYVTTPWDMMVNQMLEARRGGARHGSCGLGFGETVGRCEESPFPLSVADLARTGLRRRLRAVRDRWAPKRLAALGLVPTEEEQDRLASQAIFERFVEDCAAFLDRVLMVPDSAIGAGYQIVFEGAQGLMLDQDKGAFPYVTRSRTGLANMLAVAAEAGIGGIEAIFVHRCYVTRHGRGPMPDERDILADFAVDDPTNRPNPWQESLRFGHVDLDVLAAAVRRDLRLAVGTGIRVRPHLAITCLDQARGPIPFRHRGRTRRVAASAFAETAAAAIGLPCLATATGPTRTDVEFRAAPAAALAA